MDKKVVRVAVGVIKKGRDIFVSKRNAQQHQGGLWEFPGGKVEANESVLDALKRELQEEVNITVNTAQEIMRIEHDYGDKQVCLEIYLVDDFSGEAEGLEGQPCQWVNIAKLHELAFPEANKEIVSFLQSTF